jgi:nitrogen fixation protein NifX
MAQRIAIASSDGKNIDAHFAQARQYYIYDIGEHGYEFVETRTVSAIVNHEFDKVTGLLQDCTAVFAARIGPGAARVLAAKGLRIFETPYPIPAVLDKVVAKQIFSGGTGAAH